MDLNSSILELKGVGESLKQSFEALDIFNIRELLLHFPFRYKDKTKLVSIPNLSEEEELTIKGKLKKIKNVFIPRGRVKSIQSAVIYDEYGEIECNWYNQPYIQKQLNEDSEYYFYGKTYTKKGKTKLLSPEFQKISEISDFLKIQPLYRSTKNLSSIRIHKLINQCFASIDVNNFVTEYENEIQKEYPGSPKLGEALLLCHNPKSTEEIELIQNRIGIEEMVNILYKIKKNGAKRAKLSSPELKTTDYLNKFLKNLPFEPTGDQISTIEELQELLSNKTTTHKLIQGDVGSGKTVVAIAAGTLAVASGYDCVIMAPTTVLANQLHKNVVQFTEILGIACELFSSENKVNSKSSQSYTETRSTSSKIQDIAGKTIANKGKFIIGTHALLHKEDSFFSNVGLVIIDEQHRFGVEQRNKLATLKNERKESPHYVIMTATPIPRTLALTAFGDMEVSIIKDRPKGRLEQITYVIPKEKQDSSYSWIEEKIEEDYQVFWVCPAIEANEEDKTLGNYSVEKISKRIKQKFPSRKVQILHGKLKPEEKSKILSDFKEKKFDILVSTTVIEVGIDIPNANVMVIEAPERFGLAQLHQLRGRVGRGQTQGYCLLMISDYSNSENLERLNYFAKTTDGLKIAELDLQRRGPGEVYGKIQSGVPNLRFADITDLDQVNFAKKIVDKYFDELTPNLFT